MSWQNYIDQQLIASGKIDHAAIYSADGTSAWAYDPGFAKVSLEEVQAVVAGFKDSAGLFAKGFKLADVKYVVIKAEEDRIYGKAGKAGVVCVKTTQALIIGHYPETVQPSEATVVVEALGDYLRSSGY